MNYYERIYLKKIYLHQCFSRTFLFHCLGKDLFQWLLLLTFVLLYKHNCAGKKNIFFHMQHLTMFEISFVIIFVRKTHKSVLKSLIESGAPKQNLILMCDDVKTKLCLQFTQEKSLCNVCAVDICFCQISLEI